MPKREQMWSVAEISGFVAAEFPQILGAGFEIERVEPGRAAVRLRVGDGHLRPGGSLSGPSLMGLVDFSCYVVLLAHHGASARLSVTTGLQISFLRKAGLEDVVCEAELLKHGRTLSVLGCRVSTADGRLIANAEATYFMAEAGQ